MYLPLNPFFLEDGQAIEHLIFFDLPLVLKLAGEKTPAGERAEWAFGRLQILIGKIECSLCGKERATHFILQDKNVLLLSKDTYCDRCLKKAKKERKELLPLPLNILFLMFVNEEKREENGNILMCLCKIKDTSSRGCFEGLNTWCR
jgi:hypothetical protein